jgi:prepilin-type N-terminal cleavage/methylation domain-containing protein
MRRKLPSLRRVPVDFGSEPVCPVPIQRRRALRRANGSSRFVVHNGKLELQPRATDPHQRFDTSTLQRNHKSQNGFTLVEILVVLVLLSLIVFALMAVFSGIQRAFRASLTQTDTLEGGRAVMDLITSDLETMAPSYGISNIVYFPPAPPIPAQVKTFGPINFSVTLEAFSTPPSPLFQPLLSSPSGAMRSNVLENIFILSKNNINGVPSWIGTGYSVNSSLSDGTLYPLYRFYMATNAAASFQGMLGIYTNFLAFNYTNGTQWSHMMDGVVNLTARAYDTNGIWITNGYTGPLSYHEQNVYSYGSTLGLGQSLFCSNAVPASVQIELGTLEDRALQHAEALSGANQNNYLSNAIGQVHVFRQRVWIRNVDPSAYQ